MKLKTTPTKQLIALLLQLNDSEIHAVIIIIKALLKSKEKHPLFAKGSLLYCSGIVSEESGEFARAVNQYVDEDGSWMECIQEATHVGAVAIRALVMLGDSTKEPEGDATRKLIETITSWEKDLSEYGSLETKLKEFYDIKLKVNGKA